MGRNPFHMLVAAVLAIWCALIFVPPLTAGASPAVSRALYLFFSPLCHQIDSHSIHLFGVKCGVCARCTAIYCGFLAAAIFRLLPRGGGNAGPVTHQTDGGSSTGNYIRNWQVWLLAAAPMLADVLCDTAGLHASTTGTRLATGLLFGAAAGMILTPLLFEGIRQIVHSTTEHHA